MQLRVQNWKNQLSLKFADQPQVFSLPEWDVGLARGVESCISLKDPTPFWERVRCLAAAEIDNVYKHLQELLAAGIIKESCSPYASPIAIARKKNGKIRMCIDYCTLNLKTIPDSSRIAVNCKSNVTTLLTSKTNGELSCGWCVWALRGCQR